MSTGRVPYTGGNEDVYRQSTNEDVYTGGNEDVYRQSTLHWRQ